MKFVSVYMPWLLSVLTICMAILTGNKYRYAWILGIANQALWLVWIVVTENWGFLLMNLAICGIYIRNFIKWTKSQKDAKVDALKSCDYSKSSREDVAATLSAVHMAWFHICKEIIDNNVPLELHSHAISTLERALNKVIGAKNQAAKGS